MTVHPLPAPRRSAAPLPPCRIRWREGRSRRPLPHPPPPKSSPRKGACVQPRPLLILHIGWRWDRRRALGAPSRTPAAATAPWGRGSPESRVLGKLTRGAEWREQFGPPLRFSSPPTHFFFRPSFCLASELSTFAFTSVLKFSLARSSFRPAQPMLSAGNCAVLNRHLDLSQVCLLHTLFRAWLCFIQGVWNFRRQIVPFQAAFSYKDGASSHLSPLRE